MQKNTPLLIHFFRYPKHPLLPLNNTFINPLITTPLVNFPRRENKKIFTPKTTSRLINIIHKQPPRHRYPKIPPHNTSHNTTQHMNIPIPPKCPQSHHTVKNRAIPPRPPPPKSKGNSFLAKLKKQ